MKAVAVRNPSGRKTGSVDLDPEVFDIEPNMAVMHQVVTAQLAAQRKGTQNTLTRAEVKGGSAKPWRQKGTGRARHGSTRNPQWRSGGVALGPKPRSYQQRTPKKMIRLALRSALSDRAREGKIIVINKWRFEAPRTKDAIAALNALKLKGQVLLVVDARQKEVWKSFSNLPKVHIISPTELNAYDVLAADSVVFTLDTLPTTTSEINTPETENAASSNNDSKSEPQ
ncbi:MAG: 50S ribosomal protein L4 [Acidimicrobiia bacterium]|nr:50S ribosomal protein L4 [Acidimicrobiia bacterium]MYC58306.1 50S ribosomal protein L4 [Acidimicrobiia bacterium]MYG93481.1 50S ribosomal protein L4 [Acidimicrobiia bacterium]MYI29987.1 50S ribosomal protein L4 [Acidimicrobiia bacterium]